jgi:regulator of sirC expression with transglutaminase-like and TPR domain
MKSSAQTELPAPLAESQKKALISLLSDDDPAVYQAVRERILSYGVEAAEWLRPHTLSNDGMLRRRVRGILDHFAKQAADNEFVAFCLNQGEDFDLETGVFLLARTQFPSINAEAYGALLDSFSGQLRERLDLNSRADDILGGINEFLFEELKFTGNEKNYYDPDNSYLNRVLDRRMGNPISLCLVYLLIARRLRLPMVGIGLPGHFICRYQSTRSEIYLDVFNRGKFLTKADCIKYLVQIRHSLDEGYLAPMSPRRILLRICANLHQIYTQLEVAEGTERLQRYLVALAK